MNTLTPHIARVSSHAPPLVRFEAHYIPEPNTGCWLWLGDVAKPPGGDRPQFIVNRKRVRAHRFAFETFNGPIPDGLYVCHRCHNSYCVNPDHLYAGTARQNTDDMMRAGRHFYVSNPAARDALHHRLAEMQERKRAKATCKRGHPLDILTKGGRRACRTCQRASGRKYARKRRLARRMANA